MIYLFYGYVSLFQILDFRATKAWQGKTHYILIYLEYRSVSCSAVCCATAGGARAQHQVACATEMDPHIIAELGQSLILLTAAVYVLSALVIVLHHLAFY